jgi:glycosyltransferase involved in cell wall biosynthesis
VRIGIEACTWSNRRGYGRFLRGLATAMIDQFPEHEFVLVMDQRTFAESTLPRGASPHVVRTSEQPTRAASADGSRTPMDLLRMGWAVGRLDVDVFFFPTRYSFFPIFGSLPTVVAFHDATAEMHPELIFPTVRARTFWKAKSLLALRSADRLVTVSWESRRNIARAFGLSEDAIAVITEGPDPAFRVLSRPIPADVLERHGIPRGVPLLLYVGGISPHKNIQGLLRAAAAIGVEEAWHVVLVGDYENDSFWGCYQELVALAAELDITDRVTFTGFVPDDELAQIYNLATCLVLPSMSEGFGLPVVEAMACGLAVVTSDRGSLPEVVGDAGIVVDPTSPSALEGAVRRLLHDAALRSELQARGLERAEGFSWKAGARRMMALLEQAAGVERS